VNWLSHTIDRLDAIDLRWLLLLNAALALFFLVAHGGALLASQTNKSRDFAPLEPYLYVSVFLSATAFASALVGWLREGRRLVVLRLHAILLLVAAAVALWISLSWIATGVPGGAFTWNPVFFSFLVGYPMYIGRRVLLPATSLRIPVVKYLHVFAVAASFVISAGVSWRYTAWSPSFSDFKEDVSRTNASLAIPRFQEEPALPETSAAERSSTEVTTLLSTSFEQPGNGDKGLTLPFVQAGALPWGRDTRPRSGRAALNLIPEGNPGDLRYFDRSVSPALLSSRLDGTYAAFRVEGLSYVELEFWRLSTSNPSETHNCLGNLVVHYRFDRGEWSTKMVYCGQHRSKPLVWRRSLLSFDTTGHKEMELRFDYEYPPDVHRDRAAVYLVDDLAVRGHP
jgi:hypothetical protein